MAFAVHTFETNSGSGNLSFAFHEQVGEGQELFFLAKFSEKSSDPKTSAESIFGAIVESMANSRVPDPYDRFEDALKSANMEAAKRKTQWKVTPDIVVAFFDFNQLYLSQSGEAEAYLVRGTSVSQISETPEGDSLLFANILSGQVAIDDVVLFASSRLLRVVTTNQIVDTLSRSDFSEAIKLLRHELSASSDQDLLVTALGVGKKDSTEGVGFLSKMVSQSKKVLKAEPVMEKSVKKSKAAKKTEEIFDTEEFEEEAFVAEKEPLKIGDLLQKVKNIRNNFRPQKNLVVIAGTVLVIFLVGVGVKFIANYESAETKLLREQLSIAREALVQADTFLLQGERQSAAEYLKKSQESVQHVLSSKSKTFRSDAQFLLADIQEKQLQVENAKKVTAQLLADLGVKNDNLDSVGLLELNGTLYVHDLKNVYKTVRNIVEKGLPISDKETILAAGSREDQNTVLFLTDAPRILEYREGLISPMSTQDDTWKRGLDLKTFGKYAYILDPVENQIWKYERQRAQYAPAIAYNQGADLSRAISIAIDGAIYVLSDDGTIQKIFRGVKADYAFRELPSTPFLGKNLKLFTSPEHEFLYVLDPDNARILIFTKGEQFATYKKQVIFEVANAKDFVIDDAGQKVNILTKDKIYEFSL